MSLIEMTLQESLGTRLTFPQHTFFLFYPYLQKSKGVSDDPIPFFTPLCLHRKLPETLSVMLQHSVCVKMTVHGVFLLDLFLFNLNHKTSNINAP